MSDAFRTRPSAVHLPFFNTQGQLVVHIATIMSRSDSSGICIDRVTYSFELTAVLLDCQPLLESQGCLVYIYPIPGCGELRWIQKFSSVFLRKMTGIQTHSVLLNITQLQHPTKKQKKNKHISLYSSPMFSPKLEKNYKVDVMSYQRRDK